MPLSRVTVVSISILRVLLRSVSRILSCLARMALASVLRGNAPVETASAALAGIETEQGIPSMVATIMLPFSTGFTILVFSS